MKWCKKAVAHMLWTQTNLKVNLNKKVDQSLIRFIFCDLCLACWQKLLTFQQRGRFFLHIFALNFGWFGRFIFTLLSGEHRLIDSGPIRLRLHPEIRTKIRNDTQNRVHFRAFSPIASLESSWLRLKTKTQAVFGSSFAAFGGFKTLRTF